jgi:exosortase/archaeosortase family protein
MIDSVDFSNFPIIWLIGTFLIWVTFASIGYFIATRRTKQPIVLFLTRFLIVFSFLFFLEFAIVCLWPSFHHAIQSRMATVVGDILGLGGMRYSVSGWTVALPGSSLSFNIGTGCLGGELFCTYIALVLAETAATRKQRLTGILIGLAILLAFNFFRITLSIYVEGLTGFNIHYLFYYFNIFFVMLVWLGWLRTIRRRPTRFAGAMP